MALLFFQKTIFTPLYGLNCSIAIFYVKIAIVNIKVIHWPSKTDPLALV